MGDRAYWALFWQTGVPEFWLLSRLAAQSEAAAALKETKYGGTPV